MVNETIFFLLCSICLIILLEGGFNSSKIYQYPFLMSGIFIGFIVPQAAGLVYGVANIPEIAVCRVLIMCCLCIAMCWLGYQIPISHTLFRKPTFNFDRHKALKIGLIYVILSFIFWFLIFTLPGGYGLRLTGTSSGLFTIYLFFARILTNLGFIIILLKLIEAPKFKYFVLTFIAAAIPLIRSIFFGRRSDIIFIFLAISLSLYFIRHLIPPRLIIIFAIILSTVLIPFLGEQRGILSGKWDNYEQLEVTNGLENIVKGESVLELRNAALVIDKTANTMSYGWGSLYWDTVVFRYIPAQFLGSEFKNSLYLGSKDSDFDLNEIYGYKIPEGSTLTGIGDSFTQFDYFGCLFFGFMATLFKIIWHKAYIYNDRLYQIVYMTICPYAMFSVTHGTVNFIPDLVYASLLLFPLFYLSNPPQYQKQD
jgi:hypothetical protein